jgi:hypothetical protein
MKCGASVDLTANHGIDHFSVPWSTSDRLFFDNRPLAIGPSVLVCQMAMALHGMKND